MWPFKKKKPVQPDQQRAFAGASFGRLVADWVAGSSSMDGEIRSSLITLRNRARQLARDNDYAKQAKRNMINNVVGAGFGFQSQVRMQRGSTEESPKLNKPVNDLIEKKFNTWCKKDSCSTTGKHSFAKVQRLVLGNFFDSGEAVVRMVTQRHGRSKIPLALDVIDPDYLDLEYNDVAHTSGNEIRMGIEFNAWGRPVAYYFLPKHPGDYSYAQNPYARSSQRTRVPANEIIHLFDPETSRQSRGVPVLAATIMRLHNMQGYEDAEVISARATAALMGFVESPEGELKGDAVVGEGADAERVTDFSPGMFKYLAPGEKVNIPSLNRPSGQFDPFMRMMLRGVAAGVGASYESISRDYSNTSYSSARQAILEDRDNWRVLQCWLSENLHQVVFERWLDMAVLSGEVSLPKYELDPDLYYDSVRWMPRGWSWVDPAKEIAAFKDSVRCGFTTISEVVAQSGGDYEELVTQRKREIELAAEAGLVFDTNPATDPKKDFGAASEEKPSDDEGEEGEPEKPKPNGKAPKADKHFSSLDH